VGIVRLRTQATEFVCAVDNTKRSLSIAVYEVNMLRKDSSLSAYANVGLPLCKLYLRSYSKVTGEASNSYEL
jgi:hypothetical protein